MQRDLIGVSGTTQSFFFGGGGGSWLKDQKRIIKDHYLEDPLAKGIFLQ